MPAPPTVWHKLDLFLARLRPHREPLALLVDSAVVVLAWNITYLFRLGFERWISARPSYDGWVLLAIVLAYAAAFSALKVPQGMWRFSGFGEVKRLALACLMAGLASAVATATASETATSTSTSTSTVAVQATPAAAETAVRAEPPSPASSG